MATLLEVIGDRLVMDAHLRERARHEYEAMLPDEQRAAYVHQARILHEIISTLQLASEGHAIFPHAKSLLEQLQALVWSTDMLPEERAAPPSVDLNDDAAEGMNLARKEIGGLHDMVARDDEHERRHTEK